MTMIASKTPPNIFFIDQGIQEIFGQNHLLEPNANFTLVFFRDKCVEALGKEETAGMLHRSGRAAFYYWTRQFAGLLGWKEVGYRLLPLMTRTRRSIVDMINWLEQEGFLSADLTETTEVWRLSVKGFAEATSALECSFFLGMLQELCSWVGGGKFFHARECECRTSGSTCCVFEIDKQPAV